RYPCPSPVACRAPHAPGKALEAGAVPYRELLGNQAATIGIPGSVAGEVAAQPDILPGRRRGPTSADLVHPGPGRLGAGGEAGTAERGDRQPPLDDPHADEATVIHDQVGARGE